MYMSRLEMEFNKIMKNEDVLESLKANNKEADCYSCHGIYHTKYVEEHVKKILEEIGETEENVMLAIIAARFHDIGCILGKKNHAFRSYNITKEYLEKYNFTREEKGIILQAILDHSNGEKIENTVGAALLLADKIHLEKDRVIPNKKHVNYFNENNALIEKVELSIDDENIYLDFIVEKGYDPFSLGYWPKSILVPQKVAEFLDRKCVFKINHNKVDFNKFIR